MQPREGSPTRTGRPPDPSDTAVTQPRFDAGRVCLNLLATVGRRGSDPLERLPTAGDLANWLPAAGLLDTAPPVEEPELDETHALREAAYLVVEAARVGRVPDAGAVAILNSWASRSTPVPSVSDDLTSVARESPEPVHAALALLARDTIELVSGPELARVRACAEPGCRMLFLDNSRGARRRWCSMARCGNRAKARGHAARRRESS